MTKKQTCWDCAYKGNISGDYHICCRFKWHSVDLGRVPEGEEHGIRNGWFRFPFNFDPIWMKRLCLEWASEADEGKLLPESPVFSLLSMLR